MSANRPKRRAVVLGGLAAGLIAATAADAQSIGGIYRAEGRNPDGSAYGGTVQIVESGTSLSFSWQVGNQSYQGTGYRSGDVIWIDWGDTFPVVYVRMPSGELHGTWANGRALERLIP